MMGSSPNPGVPRLANLSLLPGTLVTSRAGRDFGTLYVVLEILGPDRVAVADGRVRHVARPKVKNVRHLALVTGPSTELVKKLENRQALTDEDLRNIIQSYPCEEREVGRPHGER